QPDTERHPESLVPREIELVREPNHCRRLHAGLGGHAAHRVERDLFGMLEDIPCRPLKLWAELGETAFEALSEHGKIHSDDLRQAASEIDTRPGWSARREGA